MSLKTMKRKKKTYPPWIYWVTFRGTENQLQALQMGNIRSISINSTYLQKFKLFGIVYTKL